jgi:hypothetical protein
MTATAVSGSRLQEDSMHRFHRAAICSVFGTVLALALAGCGKEDKPAAVAAAPRTPAANSAADAGASAEAVAKQARADLKCPATIASPARAGTAPVDDVLGVRPGLTYEEAMSAVLCSHPLLVATAGVGRGFNLKAPQASTLRQGFAARAAEPRVVKTSKQIVAELQRDALARGGNAVREDLKPGQTKWFVGTMGLPGQERVLSVAREERFAVEQSPTIESVTAALLKKYGSPTHDQRASDTRLPLLRWAYDPQGRPVAEGTPLFHRCVGMSDPDAGQNLTPDCGLVVQAMLIPQRANPDLVDRLQVGVVDQAGGWRLITATEQALGRIDQQRRAQEVDKATRNAKAPSL